MKFIETDFDGLYVVEPKKIEDERGHFSRFWCQNEMAEMGLASNALQINSSFNKRKGTLRGMHYQVAPAEETKYMRCIKGAVLDVVVDMRPDSKTYLQHFSIELSCDNAKALFVPAMFAHGYQTLEDNTEVLYPVSEFYSPNCERGLRYDDPVIDISWPLPVEDISPKDAAWPLLDAPN